MGIFDKKDHIKSSKELDLKLRKEKYLSREERQKVEKLAKKFIVESSGLSKKEWQNKVVRQLKNDPNDKIDRSEASKLKKLGK
jgi:hypothetical protein